jgi:hypothetical protein
MIKIIIHLNAKKLIYIICEELVELQLLGGMILETWSVRCASEVRASEGGELVKVHDGVPKWAIQEMES